MFPYADTSHWHVGPLRIFPFAYLTVIALAVGYAIGVRRARGVGIGREQLSEVAFWAMVAGFVGAHLLKLIYEPQSLAAAVAHPVELLKVFNGIASLGGFAGAAVAGYFFVSAHSIPAAQGFQYADAGAFAVPFAWAIGRFGCYLIHDHPGVRTSSWLGVTYPGGTRFDLGLLEMLFLLALGAVFVWLDRVKRPRGFYCVVFLISYGIFRAWLDTLHVDPPRYWGITVDQYGSMAMVLLGITMVVQMKRRGWI
jgi:phosphatidylglycerol:prolipoprotein diacylglycerol transferase